LAALSLSLSLSLSPLQPDITPDMLKPNTKLRESVSAFLKVPP
jgi:hypothetical protein